MYIDLNVKQDKIIRLGHYLNNFRNQYEFYFTCLGKCFIIEYNDNKMSINEYLGGYKPIKPYYKIPVTIPSKLKILDDLHSTIKLDDMNITDTTLLFLVNLYFKNENIKNSIKELVVKSDKTLRKIYHETM